MNHKYVMILQRHFCQWPACFGVIYMDLHNSSLLPFTSQLRIAAIVCILVMPPPDQHCDNITFSRANIYVTFTNQIVGSKKQTEWGSVQESCICHKLPLKCMGMLTDRYYRCPCHIPLQINTVHFSSWMS